MAANLNKVRKENRDPITGEPGSHPVGTGIGAAVGVTAGALGGAAAGAGYGLTAGPLGAIAGAAVGGIVGGLAGSSVAEEINPTAEEAFWSENYQSRPYVEGNSSYDAYRPAYRHGIDAYGKYEGRAFDEVEPDLNREWKTRNSPLSWDQAKPATRDAYDRLREGQDMNDK